MTRTKLPKFKLWHLIRWREGFWHWVISFHFHHLISFKPFRTIIGILLTLLFSFDLHIWLNTLSILSFKFLYLLLAKPRIGSLKTLSYLMTLLILNMYLLLFDLLYYCLFGLSFWLYLLLQAQLASVFSSLDSYSWLSIRHIAAIRLFMVDVITT